jgi:DNA-binding LacI/PurR family transcriptional regulator
MAVTLHDVARVAGVSYKTVSNVVNDFPHVRPSTRERVRAAIDDLGYQPNFAARALRSGRKNMICLAVPEIDSPYFGGLAAAVIDEASRRDLVIITEQTNRSRERELDILIGQRRALTDGVIISPLALTPSDLDLVQAKAPVVLLDHPLYNGRLDQVTLRDTEAARAVTDHLIARGHRRIAAIGADDHSGHGAGNLRYRGHRQALEAQGIIPDPRLAVFADPWRRREGAESIAGLIESGIDFTAVFAFNDSLALGAIHELQVRGLRVPEDVSVVGFDNIEDSEYSNPTLTTIDPGWRQIAHLAIEALVHRLDNPEAETRLMMSDFALVERESVADR